MLPKVTIAIIVHGESIAQLPRAIESALSQDEQIEVLIASIGSSNEMQDLCDRYCRLDARVKHLTSFRGAAEFEAFWALPRVGQGRYYLRLDQDAWLEAGYVRACAAMLDRSTHHLLVGGMNRYFTGSCSVQSEEDALLVLEQDAALERVLTYFSIVERNGIMNGLYRRGVIATHHAAAIPGWDLSFVASLAFRGKVTTVQSVYCNHQSGSAASPIQERGLYTSSTPSAQRMFAIAREIYLDIASRNPTYRSLGRLQRNALGLRAAEAVIVNRYGSLQSYVRSRLALRHRVDSLLGRASGR